MDDANNTETTESNELSNTNLPKVELILDDNSDSKKKSEIIIFNNNNQEIINNETIKEEKTEIKTTQFDNIINKLLSEDSESSHNYETLFLCTFDGFTIMKLNKKFIND
jgi:hypothetical protein